MAGATHGGVTARGAWTAGPPCGVDGPATPRHRERTGLARQPGSRRSLWRSGVHGAQSRWSGRARRPVPARVAQGEQLWAAGKTEPRHAGEVRTVGRDREREDARYQAGVGHHGGTPHTISQTGPHGTPPDGRTTRRPTERTDRPREDPQDHTPAHPKTGRPNPGRNLPGPDLYSITVPYSAANRPQRPAATGFSSPGSTARCPHSRPSSRPPRATPPQMPFLACPSRFPGPAPSHSRRGKRHSRRTNQPSRPRPHLSVQHAW